MALSWIFHYVGFIFYPKASYELSGCEIKQSEDLECTVHGLSIWGAGSLQLGSFCHQTNPSKGFWLDFQSWWTSAVLADFSTQCKSSARAEQLWMSDWLCDILKFPAVPGGPQWDQCWRKTICFTVPEEKTLMLCGQTGNWWGKWSSGTKKCGAS